MQTAMVKERREVMLMSDDSHTVMGLVPSIYSEVRSG